MSVALAVFVELAGLPVVVLELALDRFVQEQRQGRQGRAFVVDNLASGQPPSRRTRALQDLLGHQPGGLAHGPARHPGLARGGGGTGVADQGVGGLQFDLLHAELRACDLLADGDQPLPDLGRRRLDQRHRVAVAALQPHPRRRIVVGPFRVGDVLVAQRPALTARDVGGLGQVAGAARQRHPALRGRRQGQLRAAPDQVRHRRRPAHDLAGDQPVARTHGVAQPDLQR